MSQKIKNANLSEKIANAIGDSKIEAALLCTFTFNPTFFEQDVYDALLCSHGQARGSFPVTVILDKDNFAGQGWGYDVCPFPYNRLWHPKLYAFMLLDSDSSKRTALFIGSGNLTPSGWEKNLEIFQHFEWLGWVLPDCVKPWVIGDNAFGGRTRFGHWYSDHHKGKVPPSTDGKIIASSGKDSIWDQWEWETWQKWTRAYVVAPYTDQKNEEDNEEIGDYITSLVDYSKSKGAPLDVYLQGASEGRVYGTWAVFKDLEQRVRLQVFRVGGDTSRRLHAKLQILYSNGTYYILGGSPNASSVAMMKAAPNGGNVELAWEMKSQTLPKGLLPEGSPIEVKESNFVPPIQKMRKPRWKALKSVKYTPASALLEAIWINGRGLSDTIVLLSEKEVLLSQKVSLGEERAISTIPRDPCIQEEYDPDWVPIIYPFDECDNPLLEKNLSFSEYLGLLSGKEGSESDVSSGGSGPIGLSAQPGTNFGDFPWHERVLELEQVLHNLEKKVNGSCSELESKSLLRTIKGLFQSASLNPDRLTLIEKKWREWVKFEIIRFVLIQDNRKKVWDPFKQFCRSKKIEINPTLKRLLF